MYDMSGQRIEINEVSAQVLLESVLSVDLDKYQWTEPCTDYAFDPSRVDALDAQTEMCVPLDVREFPE